ncbi:hypothetical protein [Treponema brennaborense]|uniref:Uncharacterized protein n=1 Tax=Treponema brennaborense (strain DSM 12168 / CIP 105900 / DD5/3) TaxID=906968 RepID=F4LPP4_TREBD|nr:hypothetical protein [Treponema brennaborense]AEE17040.1 hypothetical protein Trebr_1617 [Treponema brennaborense DSM 12168]
MKQADKTAFLEEFEQATGDTVQTMVMARLYSSAVTVRRAGLEFPPGQTFLWGLLIFGTQDVHFFVHPSQHALLALFNAGSPSKTQQIRIERRMLTRIMPPEQAKNRFAALFSSKPKTLSITYEAADGKPITLDFEVLANNQDIAGAIERYGV